jgi:hypothetical protein
MGGVTVAAAAETIKTTIMETVPYKQQRAYERTVSPDKKKRKKGDMIDPYILNKEDASKYTNANKSFLLPKWQFHETLICSWTVSG